MIDSTLVDSKKEYEKFLWFPKKIGFTWAWLEHIIVIEEYSEMIIDGKPAKVKKVTYKLKEDK